MKSKKRKCKRCCYCKPVRVTGTASFGPSYCTHVALCCGCGRPNPRSMSWIRGDMGDKSPVVHYKVRVS